MATVGEREAQIKAIEQFDVHFIHPQSKRRLHSRLHGIPKYQYTRPAPNNMSVNRWFRTRFHVNYPDHFARVLMGNGKKARGPTRLYAVRNSYRNL